MVVLHHTEELQPMRERTVEHGPSPSLLNLVLFWFGGFVCFVLCLCFGSENPSFKYKIYCTKYHINSYFLNLKLHSQFYKVDLPKLF